jgi:hypothetical protein
MKIAKTLPNGVEIPEPDDYIWAAYRYKCVFHPRTWAVCLHEQPPKSINPYWRLYPEWRIPLCNFCHEKVHNMPVFDATHAILVARMKNFPFAVSEIDKHNGTKI